MVKIVFTLSDKILRDTRPWGTDEFHKRRKVIIKKVNQVNIPENVHGLRLDLPLLLLFGRRTGVSRMCPTQSTLCLSRYLLVMNFTLLYQSNLFISVSNHFVQSPPSLTKVDRSSPFHGGSYKWQNTVSGGSFSSLGLSEVSYDDWFIYWFVDLLDWNRYREPHVNSNGLWRVTLGQNFLT